MKAYSLPYPLSLRTLPQPVATWILLAFGVVVVLTIIAIFVRSLVVPYVGVDVALQGGKWRLNRVDQNGTAYRDGLRPGDQVVSINGLSPEAVVGGLDYIGVYRIQSLKGIDATGQVKETSAASPVPIGVFLEPTGFFTVAVAFLLLGFGSFLRRPQSRTVSWLYLMSLSVAAGPILSLGAPRGWVEVRPLEAVNGILAPWLVARFFLEFPFEKRIRLLGKDLTRLIYLPPLLLLITYVSVGHNDSAFYTWFRPLILFSLASGFLLSFFSIAHSFFVSPFGRSRQQIKILMMGVAIGILPLVILTIVPEALGLGYIAPPQIAVLGLVSFAFTLGHVILKDKLLDIDLVLSRALSYGLLFFPVMAGYILVIWAISIMQPQLDIGWPIFLLAAFTIVVALSLNNIWGRSQGIILARLSKGRYDYQRAAASAIAEVSSKTDLEEVTRTLASSLTRLLGLEGACVLLADKKKSLTVSATTGVYSNDRGKQDQARNCSRLLTEEGRFPNKAPLETGAAFLVPLSRGEKQVGMLVLGNKLSASDFSVDDVYFLLIIQGQASLAIDNAFLLDEARKRAMELEASHNRAKEYAASLEQTGRVLEQAYLDTIKTLVLALESKNPYTKQHSERVAALARRIGAEMKVVPEELRNLEVAGLIHDIGKIGIPDNILLKAGPLDHHERAEIERHTVKGVEILRFLGFLADVIPVIEYHHEWYDGTGYPSGLRGDEIPQGARILALADAYDAMTSDRPHRPACTTEEAGERLREGAGIQWDPKIVEALLRLTKVDSETM